MTSYSPASKIYMVQSISTGTVQADHPKMAETSSARFMYDTANFTVVTALGNGF